MVDLDVRLVPAALACWAVTAAGIVWPIGAVLAGCCAVLAVGSGLLWWRARGRPGARLAAVGAGLLAIGVVGAGYGLAVALRADAVAHHPITATFGTVAPVTVMPSESPLTLGSGRLMFRATLLRLRDDEISGRVVVFARAAEQGYGELAVGRPVRFTARITRPTRHDLTVAVLTATGPPALGEAGSVQRAAHAVRSRFAAAVRTVLPADQAAMLPALVLGDSTLVPAGTSAEFRTAGMTHLTAVSGANVTIVCAAVLFSARLVGPRAAVALAGLALVGFVIVVQPTASVLRAAVMAAITLLAMLTSRRRQAIPALAATVLVLLVAAPQPAVDLGFALSVVATAALVVVAPGWSRRLADRGWPKPLADAVAVAGAAQAGDGAAGRRHLGTVQSGGRRRQPTGGAGHRPDHRAGHRGGGVGRVLAGRRAATDPIHRAGGVVGLADRTVGSRGARGQCAGALRGRRPAHSRLHHRAGRGDVAMALVPRRLGLGGGHRRDLPGGVVAVRIGGAVSVTSGAGPSWRRDTIVS